MFGRRCNDGDNYRWTDHLWQGRFGAVVMDEAHLAGEDDELARVAAVGDFGPPARQR
jgi:hypothetical protein